MSATQELVLTSPEAKQLTPMDLLQVALTRDAAIDVIERLAALQDKARADAALYDFNEALSRVQEGIKRIAPDLENPSKKSKYASYAAIDRVIRPIYAKEGFSLSFTHADCPKAEHVRVICRVSLRSHIEHFQIDMPVDTKGPNGNAVMTPTHATASADSYAKRYLVKDIFNIAIGEDDTDGNGTQRVDVGRIEEHCEWMANAGDMDELRKLFTNAYKEATAANDKTAQNAYIAAKNKRRKEIE